MVLLLVCNRSEHLLFLFLTYGSWFMWMDASCILQCKEISYPIYSRCCNILLTLKQDIKNKRRMKLSEGIICSKRKAAHMREIRPTHFDGKTLNILRTASISMWLLYLRLLKKSLKGKRSTCDNAVKNVYVSNPGALHWNHPLPKQAPSPRAWIIGSIWMAIMCRCHVTH